MSIEVNIWVVSFNKSAFAEGMINPPTSRAPLSLRNLITFSLVCVAVGLMEFILPCEGPPSITFKVHLSIGRVHEWCVFICVDIWVPVDESAHTVDM